MLEHVVVGEVAVPDLVAPGAELEVLVGGDAEAAATPAALPGELRLEDGDDEAGRSTEGVEGLARRLGLRYLPAGGQVLAFILNGQRQVVIGAPP